MSKGPGSTTEANPSKPLLLRLPEIEHPLSPQRAPVAPIYDSHRNPTHPLTLQIIPPGTKAYFSDDVPTFLFDEPVLLPQKYPDEISDETWHRALAEDYREMIERYPLLKGALSDLGNRLETVRQKTPQPTSFLHIDLKNCNISSTSTPVTASSETILTIPDTAPSFRLLEGVAAHILAERATGKIHPEQARDALEKLRREIDEFGTEKLFDAAFAYRVSLNRREKEVAAIGKKLELKKIQQQRLAEIRAALPKDESFLGPRQTLEKVWNTLNAEIDRLSHTLKTLHAAQKVEGETLRGLVKTISAHQATLALAHGLPEDEILSNAGTLNVRFGLQQEAFEFHSQSYEIAATIHDETGMAREELNKILTDPTSDTEKRLKQIFGFIARIEAIREKALGGLNTFREGNQPLREDEKALRTGIEAFFNELKARALSEAVDFSAHVADLDSDEEPFQHALFLLDQEIDRAAQSTSTTPKQVMLLVEAATTSENPFVLEARGETKQARLEGRGELLAHIFERAERVEALYTNHIKYHPEDAQNEMLSQSLGEFGIQTYFWANQQTGFAHDAVAQAHERFIARYPDSPAKLNLQKLIREKAPHYFDGFGNYHPPLLHIEANDGWLAEDQVRKMNLIPGSFVEHAGADIAATSLLGVGAAKFCAAFGIGGGPVGFLAGGSICGTGGVAVGALAGPAVVHKAYEEEIDRLSYQAKMAGMELSGITPGEGDLHKARSMAMLGVGVALSVAGRTFTINLGERVLELSRPNTLKHIFGVLGEESRKMLKFGPAMGRATLGFIGFGKKANGNGMSIRMLVDELLHHVPMGRKGLIKQTGSLREEIIREGRKALSDQIVKQFGDAQQSLAKRLSEKLFEFSQGRIDRLHRLIKRLDSGDINQAQLEKFLRSPKNSDLDLLDRFAKLLQQVDAGKLSRIHFEKKTLKLFGQESDDLVQQLSAFLYTGAQQPRQGLAGQLRSILVDTPLSTPEAFAQRMVSAIGNGAEGALPSIIRLIPPAHLPRIAQFLDILERRSNDFLQFDRLLKALVRDEHSTRGLLKAILQNPTKEEVIAMGRHLEPETLVGLVTREAREGVQKAIQNSLKLKKTRESLASEENFSELAKIKGIPPLFRKFLPRRQGIESLTTRSERIDAIEQLTQNATYTAEFVDLIVTQGSRQTNETLFSALLTTSSSKELQHAMKDAIRPTLESWRDIPLSEISDISLRASRRTARRALTQATVVSDVAGEAFLERLILSMSPGALSRYGDHLTQAIQTLRIETQRTLTGELVKAMKYTPEKGVLDSVVQPLNRAIDAVLGPLDHLWAKRISTAAQMVIEGDRGMELHRNPVLWRKLLLRQAHLVKRATQNGQAATSAGLVDDIHLGPFWSRINEGLDFISHRFGTEELRRAHRLCLPFAVGSYTAGKISGEGMGEFGVICAMISGNYYVEKIGLGRTYALDIAMSQRAIGTAISKADADSDDIFDVQRTGATYGEAVTAMGVQSFFMYGLNFAEKTSFGGVMGNLPLLRRLPFAMNSTPFFNFYRGSLAKPDFLTGAGFLGGAKSLAFTTIWSTGQSMAIAGMMSGDSLMNASEDYMGWRGANYAVNGPLVNVPGFLVNRHLERTDPNADLRTTKRQLFERLLGTATQYLTLQLMDPYAGKGDYKGKQDRLLDEAAARGTADGEAWGVFSRRYSLDIIGWWERATILPPGVESGRRLRFHTGPTYKPLQLRSWYSEKPMLFSDKKEHQGYFVELAKQHPERLESFLKDVERQMSDPKASWRNGILHWKRSDAMALYYFSLIAVYYAYLYQHEGRNEYEPYFRFVERSPYRGYWERVPLVRNEEELEKTILLQEDREEIPSSDRSLHHLDDLLAHIRATTPLNQTK